MKVSLNWLRDYIDIPSSPDELEEILTGLGLEVEGMEEVLSVPGGLEGLVIGEVKTCGQHPNADRLSVTTVDVGAEELLHIVCGAPNVAAGQKVVVATPKTKIYPTEGDPIVIKKGKIRGEVSEGMICGEDEVGLGHKHEGIMVLDDHAKIGSPAAEYFEIEKDIIYEIGLTPNRSDATAHIGVAKDLLAYYKFHLDPNYQLKMPEAAIEVKEEAGKEVAVEVLDKKGAPRFSGVTISNLNIQPSPEWMQNRLKAVGVRPINNVVDITNFVLQEYGQPLHAYDLSQISDQKIKVQTLAEGAKFITLDEKERSLHQEDLMVCDGADKGMCIAGVFGGLKSGVVDATTDIFLEAAHFNALQLRKTSTRHLLRTDAAKCFEKGTDPSQTIDALKRAASLMCQYADATVTSSFVDIYPEPIEKKQIDVSLSRVNTLVGIQMDEALIEKIFAALDMDVLSKADGSYKIAVPTNKADVTREVDVIEEILRIYGFNNVPIPERLSTSIATEPAMTKVKLRKIISDVLIHRGYNEMMGLSLIPSKLYEGLIAPEALVKINNTSNIHLDAMRPEMMLSSLLAAQHNINRQQRDLSLFEIGRAYQNVEDGHQETEWITLLRTGEAFSNSWREQARSIDFHDLKTDLLAIFHKLGLTTYQASEVEDERFDYGLKFHRGPKTIATIGAVSSKCKTIADVDQDIFYAEIDAAMLMDAIKKVTTRITSIPKFPSSRRDLALTLSDDVSYQAVEKVIRKNGTKLLKDVGLFDIYKDKKHLGEGLKSYAVSMTFADEEKNLKDKAIDKIVSKIVNELTTGLGAKLR